MKQIRLGIFLPGLHRINRGAEVAFESLGREISRIPGWKVALFGSGPARRDEPYDYVQVGCTPRDRFSKWPTFPPFRSDMIWEEFSFARNLKRFYNPLSFDVTMTCSYPFLNWFLNRRRKRASHFPKHVFVTQNGDWPCRRINSEYRFFSCDGLVCINPDHCSRNEETYTCELIPNGVDLLKFQTPISYEVQPVYPDSPETVLIVSALVPDKRVLEGIEAVAQIPRVKLIVAGDGPLRDRVEHLGDELMRDRFSRVSVNSSAMPSVYRSVDAVLHMSMDEPFGNVFLESLALGLPVVAHDTNTARWITKGLAYLIDSRNTIQVQNAIMSALREPREELSRKRRGLIEDEYGWAHIARSYTRFLEHLLVKANR